MEATPEDRLEQNQPKKGAPDAQASQQQQHARQAAQEKEAMMRNNILSSVLTQEARSRLATLAVAKPDRALQVENIIIQNAKMGALRDKVDEESLKVLLEKVNDQVQSYKPKVTFERRRVISDDEDDF